MNIMQNDWMKTYKMIPISLAYIMIKTKQIQL